MNAHSPQPEVSPCPHMRRALERKASGSKLSFWFFLAKWHLRRCKKCQEALNALEGYFDAVRSRIQEVEIDSNQAAPNISEWLKDTKD